MKTFKKLESHYRHRIYTFAFYNLGEHEEAEDATQDVLIRLWKHYKELNETLLPAWIVRVTRNACIDRMRKRRSYSMRVVGCPDERICEGTSTEPGPEALMETTELRSQIQTALTRIQEPYRSVVILREIQDMKYDEIAEAVNLPLNTVKSYIHRGRKMLREELRGVVNHDAA